MKIEWLLSVSFLSALAGCEGAEFRFPPATVALPDAGAEAAEGGGEAGAESEVGTDVNTPIDAGSSLDVSTPDDAKAPNEAGEADAAPACSPVTAKPADVCPLETRNYFPTCYARMAAPPPGGCATIDSCQPTPAACQCAETFNCACLATAGITAKCKDLGGAPWVY